MYVVSETTWENDGLSAKIKTLLFAFWMTIDNYCSSLCSSLHARVRYNCCKHYAGNWKNWISPLAPRPLWKALLCLGWTWAGGRWWRRLRWRWLSGWDGRPVSAGPLPHRSRGRRYAATVQSSYIGSRYDLGWGSQVPHLSKCISDLKQNGTQKRHHFLKQFSILLCCKW